MAGKIGSYALFMLPGSEMRWQKRRTTRREAPNGVDGVEIQLGAFTIAASTYFTSATFANRLAALNALYAYEQMIGTDVPVTDEDGANWPTVTVLDVSGQVDRAALIVGAQTNGDTWELRATWLLQLPFTPTPPRQAGV